MARSQHWLDTMARVVAMRAQDALAALARRQDLSLARRLANDAQQSIALLSERLADDPVSPQNVHCRFVQEEMNKPQTAAIYFKLRRAIWNWEEFAGVSRAAMTIIHVVVELAREEAFPWYVAVPAEHTRRLARMSTRQYIRAIDELDMLAITRPARQIHIAGADGLPRFPGTVDERVPPQPIPQWVLRYRKGIPHNRKRAAWWINYDLLCETGRVQRCFMVSLRTLSKTYRDRNRRLGREPENWVLERTAEAMAALEESLSRAGPLPPPGFRAPLWREPDV